MKADIHGFPRIEALERCMTGNHWQQITCQTVTLCHVAGGQARMWASLLPAWVLDSGPVRKPVALVLRAAYASSFRIARGWDGLSFPYRTALPTDADFFSCFGHHGCLPHNAAANGIGG